MKKNVIPIFIFFLFLSLLSGGAVFAFNGPASGQSAGSGGGAFYLDSSLNVGFGTQTPTPTGDPTNANFGRVFTISSSSDPGLSLKNTGASGHTYVWYSRSNGRLALWDETGPGGQARLIIEPNGNVLIGTATSSASKFYVNGNIESNGAYVGSVDPSTITGGAFGSSNYAFRSALAVGTTTIAGLPTNGLYVAGNVGIGTINPGGYALNNAGTTYFGNTAYFGTSGTFISWGTLSPYTNGAFKIVSTTNQALSLGTNGGADKVVVDLTGDVGIGVTNPGAYLSVPGTVGAGAQAGFGKFGVSRDKTGLFFGTNEAAAPFSSTAYFGMLSSPVGYLNDFAIVGSSDSSTHRYLRIGYNTSDNPSAAFNPQVSIDTYAGNVGIGTTAPGSKLDISEGTLNLSGTTAASHGILMNRGPAITTTNLQSSLFTEWNGLGNAESLTARAYGYKLQNYDGTNWLAITNGGNVGISTTTPTQRLEVAGNIKISGTGNGLIFPDGTTQTTAGGGGSSVGWSRTGTYVTLTTSTDYVGIGTATPAEKLHVNGDMFLGGQVANQAQLSLNGYTYGVAKFTNSGLRIFTNSTAGTDIRFGGVTSASNYSQTETNFSPWMTISSGGNVGIGNTGSSYKLDVTGTGSFTQPVIVGTPTATNHAATKSYVDSIIGGGSSGSFSTLTVTGNSNLATTGGTVGIGTASPSTKLDVRGQISGGFGAASTGGTLDWNDVSNARPGNGYSLLLGSATSGPDGTSQYYHPFSFEYSSKDGSGNLTQMAIPYTSGSFAWRTRYSAAWSGWRKIWDNGNDGAGSGLDADILDGMPSAQTGTSYIPYANSSGNVGIGVSPSYKLDVSGTGQFSQPVIVGTPTATNHATTKSYVDSMFTGSGQWTTSGSNIYSSLAGNVGIGNNSPSAKLDINGTFRQSGAQTEMVISSGTVGNITIPLGRYILGGDITIQMSGSGNCSGDGGVYIIGGAYNQTPTVQFRSETLQCEANSRLDFYGYVDPTNQGTAFLYGYWRGNANTHTLRFLISSANAFDTSNTGTFASSTILAEGLTIKDPNGTNTPFVGINTANPTRPLSVNGVTGFNSGATEAMYINPTSTGVDLSMINSTGGAGLRFDTRASGNSYINVGNFGVGTTTPAYKLDIYGTGSFTQPVIVGTPTATNHAATKSYVDSMFTGSGQWTTSGTNAYFSLGGNVGIGTTNPGYKLDVSGVINAGGDQPLAGSGLAMGSYVTGGYKWLQSFGSQPLYINPLGNNVIFNRDGGNVGIATTSPAYKLDVNGTGQFTQPVIVGTPTVAGHAATKSYVDSAVTGGTGSGNLATLTVSGTSTLATTAGRVGIGNAAPTTKLDVTGSGIFSSSLSATAYYDGSYYYDGANTGTSLTMAGSINSDGAGVSYIQGNTGIGITNPGTYKLYVNGTSYFANQITLAAGAQLAMTNNTNSIAMAGGNITGVNKITASVIDPLYEIDGKKYATYGSDTIGVKTEMFGKGTLKSIISNSESRISNGKTIETRNSKLNNSDSTYSYIIDFNKAERGSDLWLFWQTIKEGENMKDITLTLTPEGGRAELWYDLHPESKQIVVHGDEAVSFSYHLVAPRHDTEKWTTTRDTKENASFILKSK